MVSTEVERYTEVDPADVPSAAWGWSNINPRTWHGVGIFVTLFLLAMMHGNHVGHVEDYVLIVVAVLVFGATVRDWWGRRRGWIR
jgi:hypothetical protein